MKNLLTHALSLVYILFWTTQVIAQPKKPTLIVLPSDNWCTQRYFTTVFDNQGTKQSIPDYKRAFQEDTELGQVISKIGSLMIERGFPLKDAEQELKAIEIRSAEESMTMSRSTGSLLSESTLDLLLNRVKADIMIQLWWKVNSTNKGKSISFTLEAFDTYTSKRIAASTGNGKPSATDIVPVLLEAAILENITPFTNQLQSYFSELTMKGREIRLTIRRWDNFELYLDDELNGKEIIDHINDWMNNHTVKSAFNMSDATENIIRFEQVRIPLFDERGRAIDARQFGRELQRFLEVPPLELKSKLMTRGLGEAILVIGEK